MEEEKNNMSDHSGGVPDDLILELNFVPDWARKPPGGNFFKHEGGKDSRDRKGRRGDRDRRPGKGFESRGRRPERRGHGDKGTQGRRRPQRRHDEPRRDQRREPVERPPVRVRFLPKHKFLSEVVRRIRLSNRTYPLMEPAHLFVSNPESCDVRLEVEKGVSGVNLYQCKVCGMVFLQEDDAVTHAFKAHSEDYFIREETETEPPAGQFSCVAKCGLSGQLIAPPNHHSYMERISEIHRLRYPDMPIDEYKSNIRTVHDEESIDRWKTESTHKVLYRVKSDQDAEPLSWLQASVYFKDNLARTAAKKTKRAILSVTTARETPDRGLYQVIGDAWRKECRFPASIMAALRGAFHNKKLHIFKAGRSATFVSLIKPVPLLPEQAIESIGEVIRFLREHPGCSREKMLEALRPGCEKGSDEALELLSPLSWLVERGHIIEFFDGTLSVPLK